MKIIVLLFISFILSFACSGDCLQCHPNLKKNGLMDENHKVLKNCINCHKVTNEDLGKMGALCGQDCWDCHNVEKVSSIKIKGELILEHTVLNDCIECHKKLEKSPFRSTLKLEEKSPFLLEKK